MPAPPSSDVEDRLARLEARLIRLEDYVGLTEREALREGAREILQPLPKSAAELEQEVGENWFGRVGIAALAVGGGFMLTLPYPDLPAAVPSAVGLVAAAGLFSLAHFGRQAFALVASYLRGAAMALLYCATLRLFFFTPTPVLARGSALAAVLLTTVALLNLAIAWRRRSPWLLGLALLMFAATPLALDSTRGVLAGMAAVAVIVAFAVVRRGWRPLLPFGVAVVVASYLLWAVGNPAGGGVYHWVATPASAPLFLLLAIAILGLVPLWMEGGSPDEPSFGIAATLTCSFGYGAFLVYTYAIGAAHFAWLHVVASSVFIWLAAAQWLRHRSQIATFFYAMTGYAALSMAIVKAAAMPDVLVWLSVESVVVIATAIWFQSRFIIVANFAIYVLVVLGYMILNERETGVSLGFGIVALVSARVLNWQRHRLELKTELMRNAYLLSALVVFPYALYHIVSARHAAYAWVALAVGYYALNHAISNQKYRLMGHATLLLSTVYVFIPGHPGFTSTDRVGSLFAVGSVLLAVSLLFTRARRRTAR